MSTAATPISALRALVSKSGRGNPADPQLDGADDDEDHEGTERQGQGGRRRNLDVLRRAGTACGDVRRHQRTSHQPRNTGQ